MTRVKLGHIASLSRRSGASRPATKKCAKALAFIGICALLVVASRAEAYPFMIRHGYTGCAPCHHDPSGEGLLTEYGRAASVLYLSTRYGGSVDEEPTRVKDFLFGIVPTPKWLALGGWIRDGYLVATSGGDVVDDRLLQMRADLAAEASVKAFRAYASLGYASHASAALSQKAWVTHSTTGPNLVAREYWIGVQWSEDAMLLRAGRINLPFGLRNVEHPTWVRNATRTDINQDQQHGVAFAYGRDPYRFEAMAILGNYQINPDRFRERGYAAFIERAWGKHFAAGISSKITHAAQDIASNVGATLQAHGLFARYAPARPLVVMAEADLLIRSPSGAGTDTGGTGLAVVDLEPLQGLHFDLAGETLFPSAFGTQGTLGAWASVWWFFFPHFDVRVDAVLRGGEAVTTVTYLGQVHAYL
ncbi:MAG TPA: hypothetical protein VJT73_12655 [Polyangiaceae bacterium]|nr:hypothetical protein [Polyangiaceae bacterium]